MNKSKSKHTSYNRINVFVFIFCIVIFDIWLIQAEYRSYQDKVEILSYMVTSNDAMKSATEILKGTTNKNLANEGRKVLEAYGYTLDKKNALFDEFLVQSSRIVGISTICFILGLVVVNWIQSKKQKRMKEQIRLLEQILSDYRNERYDASNNFKIVDEKFYKFCNEDNKLDNKSREAKVHDTFSKKDEKFIKYIDEDLELEKLTDEILALGDFLKLLNEKIKNEKKETKSLVTDISHQLKTPVAALKTSFEILQQQDLKPNEELEFMKRCNLQISGIENLLSALINISRLETGLIEIKREKHLLFETLLEAVNRVYLKAEEKNIHIEMDADELQELQIPHDRKWICEAVINLLDNAIKYSPSDTTITIRLMKRTTFLRIEIEDEGIGIPKSEYNQVFQRFYRGNSDEVKSQPGSGVGLYLTREIISRHNGTIRVQTREPKPGSVFIIQLPYFV